jgi:ribosomal protein S18 acetylase RimI-like enzyme
MYAAMERATRDDIAGICAVEARPDNAGWIGSWPAALHGAQMEKPHVAYFVRRSEAGAVAAFAILERLDDPKGVICLRRLGAASPGGGAGSALLRDELDWTFQSHGGAQIELRVRVGNPARRLYQRLGFLENGIVANRPDPSLSHLMSLSADDWARVRETLRRCSGH